MSDAVKSLRTEAPALGLTLGFSPVRERPVIADTLLLWLEVRRAMLTGEQLIAATRMTWWRDALAERRAEGAPLAERLLGYGDLSLLTEGLDAQINATLNGTQSAFWHENLARWLGLELHLDSFTLRNVFDRLEAAYAGRSTLSAMPVEQASLDLMGWCCEKPTRLHYPQSHPLLALQMLFAAFWLPRPRGSG